MAGYWYNLKTNIHNTLFLQIFYDEKEKYCGQGDIVKWRIINKENKIVDFGETCPCFAGCGNKDNIDDIISKFNL